MSFEHEWMEGGMVDRVHRIMTDRPLYIEPSLRFVPFIYPPALFLPERARLQWPSMIDGPKWCSVGTWTH